MKYLHFLIRSISHWPLVVVTCLLVNLNFVFGQTSDWELEKMPESLETEFALSSLPSHLRDNATVYLLDPKRGYYVARKGSNGFICFIDRTEWDRKEFRKDLASPISYDAEGARVIFPVYADVAAMRATGKYGIKQISDTVNNRFKRGFYKVPKPGISYMLGPLMRTYDDSGTNVRTMNVPHYMFYAPYLTAADFGCRPNAGAGEPVMLGDGKSPHGYALMFLDDNAKQKILEEHKQLLKQLAEYKPYFQVKSKG
jgi:hypothetical protein